MPGILLDTVGDYPVVTLLGKGQGVLRYLAHIVVSINVLHRQVDGETVLRLLEDRIKQLHEFEVPVNRPRAVLDVILEFVAIALRVQGEERLEKLGYVVCGGTVYRVIRLRIWQLDPCRRRFRSEGGILGDDHITVVILHDVDGVRAGHRLLIFTLSEVLLHREQHAEGVFGRLAHVPNLDLTDRGSCGNVAPHGVGVQRLQLLHKIRLQGFLPLI